MRSTAELTDLIHRKHQVLLQLRDAGRQQADLVAGGDIGALLALLAGKQQLIAALQSLENQLKPYYAEDADRREWRNSEDRTACARLANECNTLLEEIVRLEKDGAERMTVRRNEVAEQLQQVHAAGQVRNAYEAHR